MTYFIDAASFLITKRLVNWNGVEGEDWENLLDEYVKYDGFRFPGGYRSQGRDGMTHTVYQNVKINVNPGDELFVIPEELLKK
jgi:hypothetical protein